MAFQLDDVEMSIRRYLSLALGEPWRFRFEREQIADDARPVAVIEAGRVTTPRKRSALDQGDITSTVPITVTCYPPTTGTARASGRRARRLAQQLEDTITYGLDLGEEVRVAGGPLRPLAGPDRIPLYDFSAVAVEGDAEARSLPPGEKPQGWLWVEGSGGQAIQDLEDPRRWTCVLEMTVSWDRPGATPRATAEAPLVARLLGRPA